MGTKNDPGKFDCHAKAADDEPLFTLRAKDPIAPALIEAWRHIRAGDLNGALRNLYAAESDWQHEIDHGRRTHLPLDSEKSKEALNCANAMGDWWAENVD